MESSLSVSSSSPHPFSAALLRSLSQQPSSASQQPFSAALLGSLSQQPFSAEFLSSSQQPLSAAFRSSSSQQPFSAAFSKQLFSAAFLCRFLSSLLRYHLAVVKGWWSAINIILLWSRVGGQLLTQGLVVSY